MAALPHRTRTIREGSCEMIFEHDVEVPTSDGVRLRANVFRPVLDGRFPVILTVGGHAKDIHFAEYHPDIYRKLLMRHPEVQRNSSCRYMHFETVDPERWVPLGYVVVRVDSRGYGKSPGVLDYFWPREAQDTYDAIEWAGLQPWSDGKVGMLGISYFGITQWLAAGLQPPHLAAIVPWEAMADFYRDWAYHGGILDNAHLGLLPGNWRHQHGFADSPYLDHETGERVTGPEALSDEELWANRTDVGGECKKHPVDGEWYRARSADFDKITVPLLSSGNWGAIGYHLRGNVEGYVRSASQHKWLEMHTGEHWEEFYVDRAVDMQRRFLDYFLKGIDNGWDDEPPVRLAIRRPEGETYRKENEWPLARTRWTKFYLDTKSQFLVLENTPSESVIRYAAMSDGITFFTAPFEQETEITGPVALRLWVSSSTDDMDVFATLRAFDPQGKEVTFLGAWEPRTPVSQGWLRVSHRKLDPVLSTEYCPYHTHDTIEKMVPGEVYPIDVEIWATSIVLPPGYRLALTIQGKDFERAEAEIGSGSLAYGAYGGQGVMRGSGWFLHNDPDDRNPATFAGQNSIISGGDKESYLLLPVIPNA